MARPRKPKGTIESLDECRDALRKIAEAQIEITRIETHRDMVKVMADEEADKCLAPLRNTIGDLAAQMQIYYMAHHASIEKDGAKSVELTYGVIGRRATPAALKLLNKAHTWASAIAAVTAKLGKKWISYADPALDKNALKDAFAAGTLSAEQLAGCGLKVESGEQFYYEITRTEDVAR